MYLCSFTLGQGYFGKNVTLLWGTLCTEGGRPSGYTPLICVCPRPKKPNKNVISLLVSAVGVQ